MSGGLVKQLRMEASMLREIAKSEARGIEWRANLSAAAKWCDRAAADLDTLTAQLAEARESERAALIEGAGELEVRLRARARLTDLQANQDAFLEAAATIAAMRAEIERLTEREAQVKLDGVRGGIEASVRALETDARLCDCFARSEGDCACGAWSDYKTVPMERAVDVVRALDAEAIAKGEG